MAAPPSILPSEKLQPKRERQSSSGCCTPLWTQVKTWKNPTNLQPKKGMTPLSRIISNFSNSWWSIWLSTISLAANIPSVKLKWKCYRPSIFRITLHLRMVVLAQNWTFHFQMSFSRRNGNSIHKPFDVRGPLLMRCHTTALSKVPQKELKGED